MADELDEGFLDEGSQGALWSQKVYEREDGEEQANDEASDKLHCPVTSSPSWEPIIPQCCQELLAVGLSYKLWEYNNS